MSLDIDGRLINLKGLILDNRTNAYSDRYIWLQLQSRVNLLFLIVRFVEILVFIDAHGAAPSQTRSMTRVFCYLRTIRHGAYRPWLLRQANVSPRVVAVAHERLIPHASYKGILEKSSRTVVRANAISKRSAWEPRDNSIINLTVNYFSFANCERSENSGENKGERREARNPRMLFRRERKERGGESHRREGDSVYILPSRTRRKPPPQRTVRLDGGGVARCTKGKLDLVGYPRYIKWG